MVNSVLYASQEQKQEHDQEFIVPDAQHDADPMVNNRSALSKARRVSLDLLEECAHELTAEIAAASALLDTVISAAHDCAYSEGASVTMKLLKSDRSSYVQDLKNIKSATRVRTQQLQSNKACLCAENKKAK